MAKQTVELTFKKSTKNKLVYGKDESILQSVYIDTSFFTNPKNPPDTIHVTIEATEDGE